MIRWLMSWLTMKRGSCLFVDRVSGREVFLYRDCYGKEWMSGFSRWGFRVERNATPGEGGE